VQALLVLVGVDAAATLAVMAWAGGWFTDGLPLGTGVGGTVAFVAWALAPHFGMGVIIHLTARRLARGIVVTAVGVVLLTALTVGALLAFLTDDSSTAALVFLTLPPLQWLLVLATLGATALRHRWALSAAAAAAPPASPRHPSPGS
jgi:hypothetical protein